MIAVLPQSLNYTFHQVYRKHYMVSEVYHPITRSEVQPEVSVYNGPAQHNADQPAEIAIKDPGSSATLVHMQNLILPISLYKKTCNLI